VVDALALVSQKVLVCSLKKVQVIFSRALCSHQTPKNCLELLYREPTTLQVDVDLAKPNDNWSTSVAELDELGSSVRPWIVSESPDPLTNLRELQSIVIRLGNRAEAQPVLSRTRKPLADA
jgi:hypothetical protein